MYILNYLSNLTSIDSKYWVLIFKTLIFCFAPKETFFAQKLHFLKTAT